MTQTKHTPGPWRYVRANPCPTTGMHMIGGGKPGYLAEVRDCGTGCVVANARLIAAAPDMLEALKNCLNFIENTESEHDVTLSCGVIARAAIAKAEGR